MIIKVINPEEENIIELNLKFSSSKPISTEARLRFVDDHDRE